MKRPKHPHFAKSTLLLTALIAGCNNSSGGSGGSGASAAVVVENEPNDTSTSSTGLVVGETGQGTVADNTDSDFWSVDLAQGEMISIEAFAARLDQATWNAASNATRLTLYDTDGTTVLLEQQDEAFTWSDNQDTDIGLFRAPAAGTYFIGVDVADSLNAGGEYLVRIVNVSMPAPLQFEQELEGVSGTNDSDVTAEPITPGTMYGFHVDDESDYYAFDVTEPSLVTFTVQAHRNGVWKQDSYYDPEIVLYGPSAATLGSNDDTYYFDSSIQEVVMDVGTYHLEVRECCVAGNSGYYLQFELLPLSDLTTAAEVEPNDAAGSAQAIQFGDYVTGNTQVGDEDFFMIACNAGDRISVKVFDANNLSSATDEVMIDILDASATSIAFEADTDGMKIQRTILTTPGNFFLHVSAVTTQTDYALIVTQQPAGFESEPNDLVADAGTFDAQGSAAGLMDVLDDTDLYAFQGTAGVPVVFHCLSNTSDSPNGFFEHDDFASVLAAALTVEDDIGTPLSTSDSAVGTAVGTKAGLPATSLVFVPPTSGTFYLRVEDAFGTFGPTHFYVVTME